MTLASYNILPLSLSLSLYTLDVTSQRKACRKKHLNVFSLPHQAPTDEESECSDLVALGVDT